MKVLITGGAGFIGGNFAHYMVSKYPDYEIVVVDNLTYAGNLATLKPIWEKIRFYKADIADRKAIYRIF
ncbi:MAG: GDP-mannose 4,6-dehydratase, partial [Clostridia bacterium]|nr:GDP-mannose 4,6-dehydratase [Clostridia bacterium]